MICTSLAKYTDIRTGFETYRLHFEFAGQNFCIGGSNLTNVNYANIGEQLMTQ